MHWSWKVNSNEELWKKKKQTTAYILQSVIQPEVRPGFWFSSSNEVSGVYDALYTMHDFILMPWSHLCVKPPFKRIPYIGGGSGGGGGGGGETFQDLIPPTGMDQVFFFFFFFACHPGRRVPLNNVNDVRKFSGINPPPPPPPPASAFFGSCASDFIFIRPGGRAKTTPVPPKFLCFSRRFSHVS